MSIVVKATVMRQVIACTGSVNERVGAQGTLDSNFMAKFEVSSIPVAL